MKTLEEILSRCEPDTNGGCLLWPGQTKGGSDYPSITFQGIRWTAGHRLVCELAHGPIPPGMLACHSCDVRQCLHPDHLYAGTYSENAKDAYRRGRRSGFAGHYGMGENHHHAKLSDEAVRRIYRDTRSSTVIAAEHGVSPRTVRDIRTGRRRSTTTGAKALPRIQKRAARL